MLVYIIMFKIAFLKMCRQKYSDINTSYFYSQRVHFLLWAAGHSLCDKYTAKYEQKQQTAE